LHDRKWITGTVGSPEIGMCTIGAIMFAATGNTSDTRSQRQVRKGIYVISVSPQVQLAQHTITLFGEWLRDSGIVEHASVPSWNDDKVGSKKK